MASQIRQNRVFSNNTNSFNNITNYFSNMTNFISITFRNTILIRLSNIVQLGFKLDMCLWNTDAPGGNKVKI